MKATSSRPGMCSAPDVSCSSEEWIPRPEHLSGVRAVLSSRNTRKRPTMIAESLLVIDPVPRASTTNWGSQGGSGSTMVVQRAKDGVWRSHRGPQGWCLGGTQFIEPIWGERMKMITLGWRLKALLPHLLLSTYFWFPWLSPPPVFDSMTVFHQRGTKNIRYVWLRPFYDLVKQIGIIRKFVSICYNWSERLYILW